jgi:Ser/Thr protein kinase RdoA (MazF antagonist)
VTEPESERAAREPRWDELALVAEGRLSEVYAYGDGRVLKLDRPEWTGIAPMEAQLLARLVDAGLPVPHPHETVTVGGRTGFVLDRVDGRSLMRELFESTSAEAAAMAERFAAFHLEVNGATVDGLPDLVPRLGAELDVAVADPGLRAELTDLLGALDDGMRRVCHWDFHPDNVLDGPEGWVVIDWLTVASGPSAADFARTLVVWLQVSTEPGLTFMRTLRGVGQELRGLDADRVDAWCRVIAAARLAEGFTGEEAERLLEVARGRTGLFS